MTLSSDQQKALLWLIEVIQETSKVTGRNRDKGVLVFEIKTSEKLYEIIMAWEIDT